MVSKISGFMLTWPIKHKGRKIAVTYYLATIFEMFYCIGGDPHPGLSESFEADG